MLTFRAWLFDQYDKASNTRRRPLLQFWVSAARHNISETAPDFIPHLSRSRFISCHSSCQGWVTCLWGWILGHHGPDSFLKASSFVTVATSQHQHPNSSNEPISTIPMPCQCHWQSPYGPPVPFDSSLQFHGLAAAICLSMLKAAVFTYSLFPLLWILSSVFTAGQSHVYFSGPLLDLGASNSILISYHDSLLFNGICCSTVSTWVNDLGWWSDSSTDCDCAVNRGNGCS